MEQKLREALSKAKGQYHSTSSENKVQNNQTGSQRNSNKMAFHSNNHELEIRANAANHRAFEDERIRYQNRTVEREQDDEDEEEEEEEDELGEENYVENNNQFNDEDEEEFEERIEEDNEEEIHNYTANGFTEGKYNDEYYEGYSNIEG